VPKTFHIGSASAYLDANTSDAYPAIAINSANQIVEVHSQQSASDNLHYILGRIDGPTARSATGRRFRSTRSAATSRGRFPAIRRSSGSSSTPSTPRKALQDAISCSL